VKAVDAKITEANKTAGNPKTASLIKDRQAILKAKEDVLASYQLEEGLLAARAAVQTQRETLTATEKSSADLLERRKTLSEQLVAAQPSTTTKDSYDKLRSDIDKIGAQMSELKNKRQGARDAVADEETSAKLSKVYGEKDRITQELAEVNKQIPTEKVTHDVALTRDIIGPGGTTLRQLQQDFGVVVDTSTDGVLLLKGGQSEITEAAAALTAMCEQLKLNRCQDTLTYDISLTKEIIGSQGSTIERLQTQSGARINIDSKKGIITMTGAQSAIVVAKQMIQEVLRNSFRTEFRFNGDLYLSLLGKQGANLKSLQDEFTGVKHIRVAKDPFIVTIVGEEKAVKGCQAKMEAFIKETTNNTVRMTLDPKMVPLVIGRGGSTIRDIEERSGATVTLRDRNVTIRGESAQVAAAKQIIEDLTNKDELRVDIEPVLFGVLTPAILDEIKANTGADRLDVIRSERCVCIRGKKDSIRRAKMVLEGKIIEIQPTTRSSPFNPVLWTWLRDNKERLIAELGLSFLNIDRSGATVEVAGDIDKVDAGLAKLKDLLQSETAKVQSLPFRENDARHIIGQGGRNIQDIVRRSKAEVYLNRDKKVVELYGTPEQCVEAQRLIQETLAEAAEGDRARPGRYADPNGTLPPRNGR